MSEMFGFNVWWHVPRTFVSAAFAKSVLESHGISDDLISEPSRRKTVSQAVRSLQNRRKKSHQTISKPTGENSEVVTYGVLDEGHLDSETVEFTQSTTVRLDKKTGEVGVEGAHRDAVEKAVALYDGMVTDNDIRIFLRGIVDQCRGVPKRPSGGIYFIPGRFKPLIEKAQSAIKGMKCGARLYTEDIVNGIQERQNIWEAAEAEIGQKLEKALESAEKIGRNAKLAKNHQDEIVGIRQMMDVYASLLGDQAEYESIAERISDAVNTVTHKLTEIRYGADKGVVVDKKPAKDDSSCIKKVGRGIYKAVDSGMETTEATTGEITEGIKRACGSKVYDAAVDVLVKAGIAMRIPDLVSAMVEAGTYKRCATAELSVRGTILRVMDSGDTRIEKVNRGMYKANDSITGAR
jgi:hypothetical protein